MGEKDIDSIYTGMGEIVINFLKDTSLFLLILATVIFTSFNLVYYNFDFGYALNFTQAIVAAFIILLSLIFIVAVILIFKEAASKE